MSPAVLEPAGLAQAAWPSQEIIWADTFGYPAKAPTAPVIPEVIQVALVAEPAPAPPRPTAAAVYRVQVNEHVRHYLDRFQTGYRRAITEGRLARSGRYLPMILDIFREKGLPEELVFTAMIESGFNPVAVSHAGAKGLWQFMAPTARLYGLRVDRWLDERLDPEKSTVAAANYLRDLYTVFGSWDLAQAAYNAGEVRVQQAIQGTGTRDFWVLHRRSRHLLQETKNFVPAIHAATLIALQPEQYGFTVVPEEPVRYEVVAVPKGSRLTRLAGLSGVALADLEQLNPELWRKQTPPDGPYELKVPPGASAAVRTAVELDAAPRKIAAAPRPGVHVVKSGDTVWRIAQHYGVSPAQVVRWNGLERPDRILPGERLRVTALPA
ncbi:MAG: transglycosylase SLT domain-containing protein [Candidatus Rokuibacteriota bacterium]